MKKLGIAAFAALMITAGAAPAAQAGTGGPCESAQRVMDRYGIGLNMNAPLVGEVCATTG